MPANHLPHFIPTLSRSSQQHIFRTVLVPTRAGELPALDSNKRPRDYEMAARSLPLRESRGAGFETAEPIVFGELVPDFAATARSMS